jgi:hypothetical protein
MCPLCLERYIDGRDGGAKTELVEQVVDGAKTGKWICPDGGRSYAEQFIDDTGDIFGAGPWIPPPPFGLVRSVGSAQAAIVVSGRSARRQLPTFSPP